MTRILGVIVAVLIVAVSGWASGNDGTPMPPSPLSENGAPSVDFGQGEEAGLSAPGVWVEPTVELLPQAASATAADIPASFTIEWPALEESTIEAALEGTSSRAQVTGLHRPIPPGFQGNLLENLLWTESGESMLARIELIAHGAASIRVQFRTSLLEESTMTFLGTANEDLGLPPPVWSQSMLESRQSDSVAIWSPSGEDGELNIVLEVPADAELTEHFLTFESLSHRWGSGASSAAPTEGSPKHGPALDCPRHYGRAACYTSRYPSSSTSGDMRGMVVHIHYESDDGRSYVCSATLIVQKARSSTYRQRKLLLTAHHCINSRPEADSIESAHYYAISACSGSSRDRRAFFTSGGANYLAGLHSADQTLVELRDRFPQSYWLTGWSASWNPRSRVFSLHHPSGALMAYSEGNAQTRRSVPVRDYGTVVDAIPVDYYIGATEGGSSGSGLFYDPDEGYLVGVLSAGSGCDDPSFYGSFRDFFPRIRGHLDPGRTEEVLKVVGRIPFYLRDRLPAQQSFAFVTNASDQTATVVVDGSQDTSSSFSEACRFRLPARASRPFNSRDLEAGNASKGCSGIGRRGGDWTLRFRSDVPSVQIYSYARALDGTGFVTNLGGTATEVVRDTGYWYFLPLVNEGSNSRTRSTIRITNIGGRSASNVRVIGYDWEGDLYPRSGATYLARTLLPDHTTTFTSRDLEFGNSAKLRGSRFGDGDGKWSLWISSPNSKLEVTSLLSSRGLTTNISR